MAPDEDGTLITKDVENGNSNLLRELVMLMGFLC